MFFRNVTIKFKGVYFAVNVPCAPNTKESELKERARQILENVFSSSGIDVLPSLI